VVVEELSLAATLRKAVVLVKKESSGSTVVFVTARMNDSIAPFSSRSKFWEQGER
jgi:hypothetical protein